MTNDQWLTILGRVKRFAKIGGEMVSLTAAETLAASLWPDARHAVIAQPDGRKGERLVLVTDQRDAEVGTLVAHAQAVGAAELTAPRKIVRVAEIPVLGSGKTDYVAIQRMVETEAKAA
jgi:acyl-[acyl-carrier-protein]-phospholipid O-acyltransferase/long-chain-fatty-acid--[acyl-carrier-protein] ligase